MRRREFIAALGSATAWPMLARAQRPPRQVPLVGVLWHAGSAEEEAIYLGALRKGLNDLGYIEGRNIILENRFAAENPERFPVMAEELVALKPDILLAVTPFAAFAAQQASKTVPTVFVVFPDPVEAKLVTSMARPGGNITGFTADAGDLAAKRIEILVDGVGKLSRMALLISESPSQKAVIERCTEVASGLHISLDVFELVTPADIEIAFSRLAEVNPGALYIPPSGLT